MPMGINQGWYDLNETRRYPLADDASALSTDAGTKLPDGFLVDLILSSPQSLDPATFYVSRVRGMGAAVIVTIACAGTDVATFTVPAGHVRFASYTVTSLTTAGVVGRAVLGAEDVVAAMSAVDAAFDASGAPIAVTVVRPRITGVDAVIVRNADGREFRLTGAVQLAAGRNTTLSVSGQVVSVGVAGGVVYDSKFGCNTDEAGKSAVLTINGVAPDAAGNINIVGIGCVAIKPGTASLVVEDTCAKPCCGCDELEVVRTGEAAISEALSSLNVLIGSLQSKISSLELSFARSGIPT